MSKEFAARRLDVRSFAESGATLAGNEQVTQLPRLLAETQGSDRSATIGWSARGELRNPLHVQPEIWIHLQVETSLPLTCQRCLQAVQVPVAIDRSFRFVADEEAAAAQDDESEEDVLALSRTFDLRELLEDELLMALPLAPRHDVCPEALPMAAQDEDFVPAEAPAESPFAVLERLRKRKPPAADPE